MCDVGMRRKERDSTIEGIACGQKTQPNRGLFAGKSFAVTGRGEYQLNHIK